MGEGTLLGSYDERRGVKKFENVTSFGGGGVSCPLMTIDDEGEGGGRFLAKIR